MVSEWPQQRQFGETIFIRFSEWRNNINFSYSLVPGEFFRVGGSVAFISDKNGKKIKKSTFRVERQK